MVSLPYCSLYETPSSDSPRLKDSVFLETFCTKKYHKLLRLHNSKKKTNKVLRQWYSTTTRYVFWNRQKTQFLSASLKCFVLFKTFGMKSNCNFAKYLTSMLASRCKCCCNAENEYGIDLYLETLQIAKLAMDEIDKNLWCISLLWHQTEGEQGLLSLDRKYGTVSDDAIIERVHIVRRKWFIDVIDTLAEQSI